MSNQELPDVSVVIPAFNEEESCVTVVEKLLSQYRLLKIIVVDDGSTDRTWEVLQPFADRITLLRHETNCGYGAALKTGMKVVSTAAVVWFDADGQHAVEDVRKIAAPVLAGNADAVLGSRQKGSAFAVKRLPGKMMLKYVSQVVARQSIPDLNCGFRCFRRDVIARYVHLLPDAFSASSTSTLLMLRRGYRVEFFPIQTKKRVGTSTVQILRDGPRTLMLIGKLFLTFDAFLIFGVAALVQLVAAVTYSADRTVFITGALTLLLGIVSQQIGNVRIERFANEHPTLGEVR